MANRHLARTIAMQALFLWDFHGKQDVDMEEVVNSVFKSFAPSFNDQGFALHLVKGVMEKINEIDKLIIKYATEWPLNQITIVDRNVLRIGTYELVFDDDIPAKVAINEAIEIAKAFGSESSGKFVNGVLGAVFKDIQKTEESTEPKSETKEE